MNRRPNLLYIAPVMPSDTGNGLAMRAGLFLDALARDHDVFLLVVPVSGRASAQAVPAFVRTRAREVAVQQVIRDDDPAAEAFKTIARINSARRPDDRDLGALLEQIRQLTRVRTQASRLDHWPSLARHATETTLREASAWFPATRFDVVHVMRLYMAPFAESHLAAGVTTRPVCVLDLDDDESTKFRRLSALHLLNGRSREAEADASEAERFLAMERDFLPRFDAVLLCSDLDAEQLRRRHGLCNTKVIPNAIRLPDGMPDRSAPKSACLLVGNLEYYPNVDGVLFFCRDILPGLCAGGADGPALTIVGRGASEGLARELAQTRGVSFVGEVADVTPFYGAAQIAVVPLRAGGGTRIKILEAFALGTPVVSTTLGAEGIEVRDGQHLLLADTAEAFVEACRRLLADAALRDALSSAAGRLVRARYSLPVVVDEIRAAYRGLGRNPEPGN